MIYCLISYTSDDEVFPSFIGASTDLSVVEAEMEKREKEQAAIRVLQEKFVKSMVFWNNENVFPGYSCYTSDAQREEVGKLVKVWQEKRTAYEEELRKTLTIESMLNFFPSMGIHTFFEIKEIEEL